MGGTWQKRREYTLMYQRHLAITVLHRKNKMHVKVDAILCFCARAYIGNVSLSLSLSLGAQSVSPLVHVFFCSLGHSFVYSFSQSIRIALCYMAVYVCVSWYVFMVRACVCVRMCVCAYVTANRKKHLPNDWHEPEESMTDSGSYDV